MQTLCYFTRALHSTGRNLLFLISCGAILHYFNLKSGGYPDLTSLFGLSISIRLQKVKQNSLRLGGGQYPSTLCPGGPCRFVPRLPAQEKTRRLAMRIFKWRRTSFPFMALYAPLLSLSLSLL